VSFIVIASFIDAIADSILRNTPFVLPGMSTVVCVSRNANDQAAMFLIAIYVSISFDITASGRNTISKDVRRPSFPYGTHTHQASARTPLPSINVPLIGPIHLGFFQIIRQPSVSKKHSLVGWQAILHRMHRWNHCNCSRIGIPGRSYGMMSVINRAWCPIPSDLWNTTVPFWTCCVVTHQFRENHQCSARSGTFANGSYIKQLCANSTNSSAM
jgi:hypothetical protein